MTARDPEPTLATGVVADDAPLGESFESILELPDVVFDLEVTTNRPDVMGMVGVARELAAWFDVPFRVPSGELATVPGSLTTSITISAPDGCNRFVAREIQDVTVGPSPLWMRERLRRNGVRAISNVVDVTNYVMLELGHPLHAFDAARIEGDRLDVRWAAAGETLVTLDDVERRLSADDLVIVDDAGPTSLAAVMGGARSEVRDDTRRVLMEAASWDPPTVMYTSRRHDLRSEASARFERGVDPNLGPLANARACGLLVQIGGGVILEETIDVVANPFEPVTISMPIEAVQRVLDDRFTVEWSAELLRRLNLTVEVDGDVLHTTVPTYRPDLTRPADLIEELARLADFDTFTATVPTGPAGGLTPEQTRSRRVHDVLRGLGLYQAMNLPFVSPEELAAFGETSDGVAVGVVTVKNPLREDQAKLRQSLLPALLRNVRDNRNRGAETVGVFESGRVFFARPWEDDPRVPEQPVRLAIAVIGPHGPQRLDAAAAPADATTALAIVNALGDAVGVTISRRTAQPAGFHPTRSAELVVGDTTIGAAGELHPDVADMFDLTGRVAVVELDLAPLIAAQAPAQMRPVSTFPHVDFDLSFQIAPEARAATLVAETHGVSDLVERAVVFDDYRDQDLRAVAIRYRLRARDRTLTSDEIADVRSGMIDRARALGATLRGGE